MKTGVIAVGAFLASTGIASADVLVDQPHDFINGLASELNTIVDDARTADDFTLDNKYHQLVFSFDMIVTIPAPGDFAMELYSDSGDGPGSLLNSVGGGAGVEDLGTWNGTSFHLFRVTLALDPDKALQAGTYWVTPIGLGNGQNNDRAFWGTSGAGAVNGSEGYFKSDFFGFFDWTRVSDVLGAPTDFAFTVNGEKVPAPGAVALLGLAGLVSRRRRRA